MCKPLRRLIFTSTALILSATCWSQGASRVAQLASPAARAQQAIALDRRATAELHEAAIQARQRGWPITGQTPQGANFLLRGKGPMGRPLYYMTLNTNAAISTGADLLQQVPYNLDGADLIAGVWDGGLARATHQEFNQTGSTRIIGGGDGAAVDAHASAVAGTMIAAGVDAGSLGMAPKAFAECYDYLNDLAEMTSRVAASPAEAGTHLQVSNHSYGDIHGWQNGSFAGPTGWYWFGLDYETNGSGTREDLWFGRYGEAASDIDTMAYGAPYWLFFKACGNDRDDNYGGPTDGSGMFYFWNSTLDDWESTTYTLATAPYADGYDNGGFDTMIDNANAKNIIAVGSVGDAVSAGLRNPPVAAMSNYGGWGPSDDGRVEPDIVANGQQLRTPVSTSDTAYASSASGTSFSAPNAAGTALLLIDQAARRLNGAVLRASTIKGLMLHTATDMGRPGPDYSYGWGLPDGTRAADVITSQSLSPGSFSLLEGLLEDSHPGDSFDVAWDGAQDLIVSICWTDPPSDPLASVVDSRVPALLNDLDLRITGPGGTFYPFVLNPDDPTTNAITGDNVVDTIEQIIVPAGTAAGAYTATVSHKGTLTNGEQWYSFVAEGHSPAAGSAPSISSVAPAQGEVIATVDVAVDGTEFQIGMQLELRRSGLTLAEATNEYAAPGRAFGQFDLSGLAIGLYDVVAVTPDGQEALLAGGFEVVDTSGVDEWRILQ